MMFRGPYYFLSNFCLSLFIYDGLWYANAEAAFQAHKVEGQDARSLIAAMTPS